MNLPEEIPLFPLDVVLLPRRRLPLHIFEPRYREMISMCIQEGIEFGIVRGNDESFESIGCAGRVAELLNRFPDGRMNIVSLGTDRFRVIERIDTHAYISGRIEIYEDEEEELDVELADRVQVLYDEALSLSLGWYRPRPRPETDYYELSFEVASNMQLTPEELQIILEMTSTNDRLDAEEKLLELALRSLRKTAEKLGGNGHISPN